MSSNSPFVQIADDNYITSMLRRGKYDVEKTLRKMENFAILEETHKEYTSWDGDHLETTRKLLNKGIVVILPERDRLGRIIIIMDIGKRDTNEFSVPDLFRSLVHIVRMMECDEITSLTGFSIVFDGSNAGFQHIPSFTDVAFLARTHQTAIAKLNQCIMYKLPTFLSLSVKLSKTFLSTKMQDRIMVVGSNEELHEILQPAAILPEAYGGRTNKKEAIESFDKLWDTEENVKLVASLRKTHVNLSKVPKKR